MIKLKLNFIGHQLARIEYSIVTFFSTATHALKRKPMSAVGSFGSDGSFKVSSYAADT